MLLCVCRFGISFAYVIKSIDSKLISVYLINDYSLFADLHIFVYGRAECASISLECTKVKLIMLNNFDGVQNLLNQNRKIKLLGGHFSQCFSKTLYVSVSPKCLQICICKSLEFRRFTLGHTFQSPFFQLFCHTFFDFFCHTFIDFFVTLFSTFLSYFFRVYNDQA